MTGRRATRRDFLKRAVLAACAPLPLRPALAQGAAGRVVVIGGGFAGSTCAGALKRLAPRVAVTLVEQSASFTVCPLSNGVITGLRDLRDQERVLLPLSRRSRNQRGDSIVRRCQSCREPDDGVAHGAL